MIFMSAGTGRNGCTCVVLVACGSGINYILDTLQSSLSDVNRPLMILYSTRDAALLDWIENAVTAIVAASGVRARIVLAITNGGAPAAKVMDGEKDEMARHSSVVSIDIEGGKQGSEEDLSGDGKKMKAMASSQLDPQNVKMMKVMARDGGEEVYDMCANPLGDREMAHAGSEVDSDEWHSGKARHSVTRTFGRIDFAKYIPDGSHVYCQGNKGLKDTVEAVCKVKESKYVGGNGGQ